MNFFTVQVIAQVYQPVKWYFNSVPVGDHSVQLSFTANLDDGWHIYSQFIGEDGPLPTTFSFDSSEEYSRIGNVTEQSPPVKSYDKTFMMEIAWFAKTAVFTQEIRLNGPSTTVNGKIEFMVCTDEMCLPPDVVEFSIATAAMKPTKKRQTAKRNDQVDNQQKDVKFVIESIHKNGTLKEPTTTKISKTGDSSTVVESPPDPATQVEIEDSNTGMSLGTIFIGGLIAGIAALVMPCIFPMIPSTISYFTKRKKSKGVGMAVLYGIAIIVLYVSLGLIITIAFGSDALNELSTSGLFNLFYFALLNAFALSLFGAFEITLPHTWLTKADQQSEQTGFIGIVFMAVTLALVSFSCTGPLIGTLLVEAAAMGNYLAPAIGMLGFSIALAAPFTVFAMFPGWLRALPKSGSWLNTLKVALGFLEIALAMKFLSNVDLAYHWNTLDREVFLASWIIIFSLLGFYLLGWVRLSTDTDPKQITPYRLFLSIPVLVFTVFMIPGLWGAPLKSISAFLPPPQTQDFDLYLNKSECPLANPCSIVPKKYSEIFHAPYGLDAFFDYEEGLAYAKQVNKPVMLDFTGHACVNCRKMETVVWSDQRILDRLRQDYILIQLYVDDKTELPAYEQTTTGNGKKINTIGNKWSALQASTFNTNAQPWYVLLGKDGERLTAPRGAIYDPGKFEQFLNEGLISFRSR